MTDTDDSAARMPNLNPHDHFPSTGAPTERRFDPFLAGCRRAGRRAIRAAVRTIGKARRQLPAVLRRVGAAGLAALISLGGVPSAPAAGIPDTVETVDPLATTTAAQGIVDDDGAGTEPTTGRPTGDRDEAAPTGSANQPDLGVASPDDQALDTARQVVASVLGLPVEAVTMATPAAESSRSSAPQDGAQPEPDPAAGSSGRQDPAFGAANPAVEADSPAEAESPVAPPEETGEEEFPPGTAAPGTWTWPLSPTPLLGRLFERPPMNWNPGHRGVDLIAEPGQEILAPADGVIHFAGPVRGQPALSVRHPTGVRSTFEAADTWLKVGTRVHQGQVIGHVRETRHCQGCLHWGAVRNKNDYEDPLGMLGRNGPPLLLPLGEDE